MAEHRSSHRRWWRRRRDWPLVTEAVCCLAVARVMLRLQPFPRIARRLTRAASPAQPVDAALLANRVGWAVHAASRRLPWHPVCFDQAIAAQQMLRRRGLVAEIVYGVRHVAHGVDAHVWVRLEDGEIVVGGETSPLYQPIALFRPGRDEVTLPTAQ
ncbi:lasso peptide biosynthesis B2 protein [Bradyrhizobium sp. HKCCYLS20291]|uniref:lasso peptide biosynthesis B2 protein n=1 Tax=Bradyrhizobium sp. HKCCYLS20291 TaxID=3420766 RepID=UPI003EB71A9B